MQNQFNKLLLATVISASVVTTAYGATDGNAAIALDQRAQASANAEQALQGSPGAPLTTDETLDAVAAASNQAIQNTSGATQAAGALPQAQSADQDAPNLNASAVADVALMAAGELSAEGNNVREQIQASAASTANATTNATTNAATSELQGVQAAVVDGANSGRAEIANYRSVAGQVLQSGQAATANLSEQTGAAIQSEVSRAVSAAPGTSLPAPEVTVNGRAQADVSGSAGLTADTQRLNLNTQQRMQTDIGFSSSGRGSANTALGSSTRGSAGGLTSGVGALGTGSLLR